MNANELATALFHYWNETERFAISETLLNDCADMLRQQQAEIEALKAGKIRAYDNGVEDGKKPDTNLVKELTDEEIEGIARANVDGHSSMEQLKWFAKAILRKSQEK
jgi:hypothetical protein